MRMGICQQLNKNFRSVGLLLCIMTEKDSFRDTTGTVKTTSDQNMVERRLLGIPTKYVLYTRMKERFGHYKEPGGWRLSNIYSHYEQPLNLERLML